MNTGKENIVRLTENQLRRVIRSMLAEIGFMDAVRIGRGKQNRRNRPKIKPGIRPVQSSGSFADYDNEGDLDEADIDEGDVSDPAAGDGEKPSVAPTKK